MANSAKAVSVLAWTVTWATDGAFVNILARTARTGVNGADADADKEEKDEKEVPPGIAT